MNVTDNFYIAFVVDVLEGLRERLDGKCNSTCLRHVAYELESRNYDEKFINFFDSNACYICKENFHFIACKKHGCICPCNREPNPDELFFRLDETIEELKEKIGRE